MIKVMAVIEIRNWIHPSSATADYGERKLEI